MPLTVVSVGVLASAEALMESLGKASMALVVLVALADLSSIRQYSLMSNF